jgi:hypothetical protein
MNWLTQCLRIVPCSLCLLGYSVSCFLATERKVSVGRKKAYAGFTTPYTHKRLNSALDWGSLSVSRSDRFSSGKKAPGNPSVGGCMASRAGLGSMYLNRFPTIKFTVLTTLCFWNKTPRHLEICFSRFDSEDFETSENDHQAAQCHIPEEMHPQPYRCESLQTRKCKFSFKKIHLGVTSCFIPQ